MAGELAGPANAEEEVLVGVARELLGDGALGYFRVAPPAVVIGDPVIAGAFASGAGVGS